MDSKEFRGLMEAYAQVHSPQEVDEAVKGADPEMRKAASAERRAGDKPLPAKEGEKFAKFKASQISYIDKKTKGKHIPGMTREEVEEVDEATYSAKAARAGKDIGKPGKMFAKIAKEAGKRYGSEERGKKVAGAVLAKLRAEEVDIFDVVLEFLQAEGYAETLEEAEWMMANVIDEEAIDIILGEGHGSRTSFKKQSADERGRINRFKGSKIEYTPHKNYDPEANRGQGQILRPNQAEKQRRKKLAKSAMGEEYVDEAQVARENPEKYEREQSKKYAPVRGERTPMPPRGDKRREDFEKWYRANVR